MFKYESFFLKSFLIVISIICFTALSQGAYNLLPWSTNTDPSDVYKTRTEDVTSSSHPYSIVQGGWVDGAMYWYPFPQWAGVGEVPPAWESNRQVKLENIGTTDVINPWVSNGRNLFRNKAEIVSTCIGNLTDDREKCLALYNKISTMQRHMGGNSAEIKIPVKALNVYGHNNCTDDSTVMELLWHQMGYSQTGTGFTTAHSVSQVYYGGRWNMFDSDMTNIALKRDNFTLGSGQELGYDHDLIKRNHQQGMLNPDGRAIDEDQACYYINDTSFVDINRAGGTALPNDSAVSMNLTLRANEAITWRWGHLNPVKYFRGTDGPATLTVPDYICNGLWEYNPDFTNDTVWRNGAITVTSITNTGGVLTATSGTGTIIWKITVPYVIVGGSYTTIGSGAVFSISWDNSAWTTLSSNSLDSNFPSNGTTARYSYYLKCELSGSATLSGLQVTNDMQMALLALPGMRLGTNGFTYTDESASRNVRITHEWVERSANHPPNPPASATYPANGGESDGTDVCFKWNTASDPDGDGITDYRFQLSEYSDMRWPLSSNFDKLVSRTIDTGKAQLTLPYPGLLTPDRAYYWRVKAIDNHGAWGEWSNTWSFTPRGPDYPINVIMDTTTVPGTGTLKWSANPVGRAPAKYRIYGSDEKGFTVSDSTYTVRTGATSSLGTNYNSTFKNAIFPSNFVAETTATQLDVIGPAISLPNTNKAYYRVVAVDANNKRSWSNTPALQGRLFIAYR